MVKTFDLFLNESRKETFDDYPQAATENAKKAIRWREEHGDEVKAGTTVGWTRARQLADRKPLSRDVVSRMSQFNRHRQNSKISKDKKSKPWTDSGYVAWLLWGGDEGVDWAIRKMKTLNSVNETADSD